MKTIYREVTCLLNAPGRLGHGERIVVWTGRNTTMAIARKVMERIQRDNAGDDTGSDFRVETREVEEEI